MTTILELNDADLTLYRDGRPVYRAPGIAIVTDRDVLFGDRALRLSRVHPRQANLQYFSRMSADPLAQPGLRARNQADLVYLHLLEIAAQIEEAIVLAVPGAFSSEQLGVLLGILHEAGVQVAGFVDSATAAATIVPLPAQAWHLDVLLHRAVLTSLTVDDHVSRRAVEEVTECGLVRLLDGWMKVVADRFIRETRFDPLHSAATEQQLFNQIFDPVWGGSREPELTLELVQGDQTRRVEIGRQILEERAAPRFRQIAQRLPGGAHMLVTARSAALPGLLEGLREAGLTVTILSSEALPLGCEQCMDDIVTAADALRLITRLPRSAPLLAPPSPTPPAPARQQAATAVPAATTPSHALDGHQAYPLGHAALGFSVQRHGTIMLLRPTEGLTLNGAAIFRDTALEPGDRIALGERDYLVISVEG